MQIRCPFFDAGALTEPTFEIESSLPAGNARPFPIPIAVHLRPEAERLTRFRVRADTGGRCHHMPGQQQPL